MAEVTITRYMSGLKSFLSFLSEMDVSLLEVDKRVLKDFIHHRRSSRGKQGRGVQQKTLENDFSALQLFYDYPQFDDYVLSNPVPHVRKRYLVRYKDGDEDDESPRKLISVDEMAMLVSSILSPRDKAVVLVLAKTGMRRNELVSVDLGDIDWQEQSFTLKRRRFKKRSNRKVFFDDETARVLKSWLGIRATLGMRTQAPICQQEKGQAK